MTCSWWGVGLGSGSCLLAGDLERLFAEMEDVHNAIFYKAISKFLYDMCPCLHFVI